MTKLFGRESSWVSTSSPSNAIGAWLKFCKGALGPSSTLSTSPPLYVTSQPSRTVSSAHPAPSNKGAEAIDVLVLRQALGPRCRNSPFPFVRETFLDQVPVDRLCDEDPGSVHVRVSLGAAALQVMSRAAEVFEGDYVPSSTALERLRDGARLSMRRRTRSQQRV